MAHQAFGARYLASHCCYGPPQSFGHRYSFKRTDECVAVLAADLAALVALPRINSHSKLQASNCMAPAIVGDEAL
jgi:hypothetical protein